MNQGRLEGLQEVSFKIHAVYNWGLYEDIDNYSLVSHVWRLGNGL